MKNGIGAATLEHVGGGQCVGIGYGAIVLFGNLRDGNAEAEKTGVDVAEGLFDGGVIQKIFVNEGSEFGIGVHEGAASNGADFVNDGGGEAGVEDSGAGGTCGAEEEDFHVGGVYTIDAGLKARRYKSRPHTSTRAPRRASPFGSFTAPRSSL